MKQGAEYEPYGPDWRKYLMSLTKQQIIDILRHICINHRDKTPSNTNKNRNKKETSTCT